MGSAHSERLIIATANSKKFAEIKELLGEVGLEILFLKDLPFSVEIIEDGKAFWENAVKKALAIAYRVKDWVLADDSGLEVDAMGGAPGVLSARFAGEPASDQANNQKLLDLLKEIPPEKRTARFRCSVAVAHQGKLIGVVEGKCEGTIALSEAGSYGFGYDPLFIPQGHQETFAQLGPEVKHKISHRAQAIQKAKDLICGPFPLP